MNPGESYAYGASAPTDESSSPLARAQAKLAQRLQIFLDKSVPKRAARWSAYACVALVYAIRAYFLRGYYIVPYGLGIYNLNLKIGFQSPRRRRRWTVAADEQRTRIQTVRAAIAGV